MCNLVLGIDLGKNLAACLVRSGRPFVQAVSLHLDTWEQKPGPFSEMGRRICGAHSTEWRDNAARWLRDVLTYQWALYRSDIALAVYEETWLHPIPGKPRIDPGSLVAMQRQAVELGKMFGERAVGVDPATVSQETGIAKAAEYEALALHIAAPGVPDYGKLFFADKRAAWEKALSRWSGKRGGRARWEHPLSAAKLALYGATRLDELLKREVA